MIQQAELRSPEFLGQARLGPAIWRIAWPVMLMHALYTAMNVVDMFWVGKLGHVQVAAASLSGSVLAVLFAVGQVFATPTLALAARSAGALDRSGVQESMRHALLLAAVCATVMACLTVPFTAEILQLFRAAPEVVAEGRTYLALILAYLPGFFCGMVAFSVFQALGDTRTPMLAIGAANVLNIILDPILIFGWLGMPRLGLAGAGVATLASQLVWLLAMVLILRRRGLLVWKRGFNPRTFRAVFKVGVPAGLQAVTRPLTGMVMFGIVTGFGTAATAAFGIGLRILQVMFIYLGGLGAAGEALVGQSIGARRPDLALRTGNRVTLIASLVQLGVLPLVFVFAPLVVAVFNQNPDVVRFGTGYLRVLAPVLVVLGLVTGWASAQRGAGDTRPPMLAAVVSNWLVKIPLAWALAYKTGLGLSGVWLGIGISILVEAAILGIAFFRGNWRTKELVWR